MAKRISPSFPHVSILTPVFNAERFLAQTVQSVVRQTHPRWTLQLLIDPQCTDGSEALARKFAKSDSRIQVIQAPRSGVSEVRNCGLELARGPFVAFLDSDDLWLPHKLERQLRFLTQTGSGICSTGFRRISESGNRVGRFITVPERMTYRRLLQQNCILCSSVLLDLRKFKCVRFPVTGCEDFALWLSLLRPAATTLGLREDLVRYRIVKGSRGSGKWRSLRETWQIFRVQEKLNGWRAVGLMGLFVARGIGKYARF
jgi:teichuronic acid biosynthesis glycosyltransferase TuaG